MATFLLILVRSVWGPGEGLVPAGMLGEELMHKHDHYDTRTVMLLMSCQSGGRTVALCRRWVHA